MIFVELLLYFILSYTFRPILQAAKSRISRETHGLILLEGHRLIADAIHAGAIVKYVYFNRYEDLESLPIGKISAEFFKMRYHHLKIWSAVQTPPSVMGKSPKTLFSFNDIDNIDLNTFILIYIYIVYIYSSKQMGNFISIDKVKTHKWSL